MNCLAGTEAHIQGAYITACLPNHYSKQRSWYIMLYDEQIPSHKHAHQPIQGICKVKLVSTANHQFVSPCAGQMIVGLQQAG